MAVGWVLGAILAIFVAGLVLAPFDEHQVHWWSDTFWTLASLLTGLKCLRVARHARGSLRYAWVLFGLACLSWFGGMLVWDYQELVLRHYSPFPYWSDIGFLGFGVLMAAGLVFYHAATSRLTITLLEISQLGIFAACILIVHLAVFADPLRQTADDDFLVLAALTYPVVYMSLLIYAVAVLWARMQDSLRRNLGLLTLGIATHSVVNTLYAYALLGQDYTAGHYLDVFWLAGFALIYLAARDYQLHDDREQRNITQSEAVIRKDRLIPVGALLLTLGILVAAGDELHAANYKTLLTAILILLAFAAVREWASTRAIEHHVREVEASKDELQKFFSLTPAMIAIFRIADNRYVEVNEAYCSGMGYDREELLGRSSTDMGIWADPEAFDQLVDRILVEGAVEGADIQMRTRNGEVRDVLLSLATTTVGSQPCLLSTAVDVTGRKLAEAEMRKLSSAVEQAADMVMITNRQGDIEYINPAFERITGYKRSEVVGSRPNLLKSGKQRRQFYTALWKQISNGQVFNDVLINRRKDGGLFYEQKSIMPLRDDNGDITHFVSTGRDITDRIEVEERLRFMAHHDPLTELPNRTALLERMGRAIAAARSTGKLLGVLFLDVDRFKFINDTLGHDAGDLLLRQLGERLVHHLRGHDSVARFGGDEFVLLVDDVDNVEDVRHLAERILDSMKLPFVINAESLTVNASLGIGLFPHDGDDASTLLRHADAAMYQAKGTGGNTYLFYSEEIGAHAENRLLLENELRRALDEQEFVLHYQPQVDIGRDRPCGFEALIRWAHPRRGLVPPTDFIDVLEETGLIIEVGQWVLRTAIAQLAHWHSEGWRSLSMAVNLSSRQFERAGLIDYVDSLLSEFGLEPGALELEVTEGALLQDIASTTSTLEQLSHRGVGVALDDFGTGYSSLSYLTKFPFNTLKIDRAFVRDIPADPDSTAIVRAIVAMGQGLHLRLIAEGVETDNQRLFLDGLGCNLMQGYLFRKPMDAEAVTEYLASLPAETEDRRSTI